MVYNDKSNEKGYDGKFNPVIKGICLAVVMSVLLKLHITVYWVTDIPYLESVVIILLTWLIRSCIKSSVLKYSALVCVGFIGSFIVLETIFLKCNIYHVLFNMIFHYSEPMSAGIGFSIMAFYAEMIICCIIGILSAFIITYRNQKKPE